MNIRPIIQAPMGVQLNRMAFALYGIFFTWPIWKYRHTITICGQVHFECFILGSLLGLFYSCIRARRSRWILALFGLGIPAVFWTEMCLMEFSRPEWWEWPFDAAIFLVVIMGFPIFLAASLFADRKTHDYFSRGGNQAVNDG